MSNTRVTERGLEWLLAGTFVEVLWARSLDLTDDDLSFITAGIHLKRLGLAGNSRISGSGFGDLRCPSLEQLDLSDCRVSEQGLSDLSDTFTHLKSLYVQTELSTQNCRDIARIQSLEELVVESSLSNDEELAALSSLQNLSTLIVSGCQVTDAGLRAISGLPQLRDLDVEDTLARGHVLERFPQVESLILGGGLIDEETLRHISAMPRLKKLRITRSPVFGEAVTHLSGCESLRYLTLCGIDVGTNCLSHLTRITGLELHGCELPEGAMAGFEQLTNLSSLTLDGCRVSDGILNSVANVPRLHTFVLTESEGVTDEFINRLLSLKHIPVVKSDLSGLTKSARSTIRDKLTNLEYIGHP